MAAGGLAKLLKGAKKAEDVAKPAQIGNYQDLPLKLTLLGLDYRVAVYSGT